MKICQSDGDHIPHMLVCSHTICTKCLKLWQHRSEDKSVVRCPLDHSITIPPDAESSLPLNEPLAAALASGKFDEDITIKNCEAEDCPEKATKFCPTCESVLCEDHTQSMHSVAPLKKHAHLIEELGQSKLVPTCLLSGHNNNPLLLRCCEEHCNGALICTSCLVLGPHKGHSYEELHDAAGRIRSEIEGARVATSEIKAKALLVGRRAGRTWSRLVCACITPSDAM